MTKLYACPNCRCTDVQITAWVYANTGLNTNDESPAEYAYCPQCEDSDLRDRDLILIEPGELKFYRCGCCECYHPTGFTGDCRDNSKRFVDLPEGAIEVER